MFIFFIFFFYRYCEQNCDQKECYDFKNRFAFSMYTCARRVTIIILDSERSEECIVFTMMFIFFIFYFFFYTVNRIATRKSAPISMNGIFSFRKLHLVDTFKRSFFDFLNSFWERCEKLRKNYEKSLKTGFRQYRA